MIRGSNIVPVLDPVERSHRTTRPGCIVSSLVIRTLWWSQVESASAIVVVPDINDRLTLTGERRPHVGYPRWRARARLRRVLVGLINGARSALRLVVEGHDASPLDYFRP